MKLIFQINKIHFDMRFETKDAHIRIIVTPPLPYILGLPGLSWNNFRDQLKQL